MDFFLQPKEKGCTEMGSIMVRPKIQMLNKTWRHLGTRLTHRKILMKSPGSTGLGGHSSKLGPYKIQKLKDFFFSPFSLPQYDPLSFTWRGAGALGELSSCRMLRGERPVPPDVAITLLLVLRLTGLLPSDGSKHISVSQQG